MGLLRLRYATFALLIVMVAGVCCANALPRKSTPSTSDRTSFLRFGQSLAVADFDGDNHIDTATLSGAGRSKDIEIHLSRAKARILLRFNTLTSELGSLFTSDIDNDGDNDLIWSDLLRADNVVVWLDDGTGRFERVCPTQYANTFVISTTPSLLLTEIPHLDIASSPGSELSAPPSHSAPVYIRCSINERRPVHQVASSLHLRTHFVRGPPDLV